MTQKLNYPTSPLRKTKMMVSHKNLLKESEMDQAHAKRQILNGLNDKSPLDKYIYTGWFDTWLSKLLSKKRIRENRLWKA